LHGFEKIFVGATFLVYGFFLLEPSKTFEKRRNTFPLSSYPMYSQVFNDEKFELNVTEFEINGKNFNPARKEKYERQFQRRNTRIFNLFSTRGLNSIEGFLEYLRRFLSPYRATEVTIRRSKSFYLAFPAEFKEIPLYKTFMAYYNFQTGEKYTAHFKLSPVSLSGDEATIMVNLKSLGYDDPKVKYFTSPIDKFELTQIKTEMRSRGEFIILPITGKLALFGEIQDEKIKRKDLYHIRDFTESVSFD
jgi:hypothetical protein